MEDSTKKALMAVGVGVGVTAVVATAMYFLGGREAPKVPSTSELTGLAKRELLPFSYSEDVGLGAVRYEHMEDLPKEIRKEYASFIDCSAVKDSDTGDIIVSCRNRDNRTTWKDHWIGHRDSYGGRTYTLGAPYGD